MPRYGSVRHRAPPLPDGPPDTGDLRGDVLAVLRLVVRRTRYLAPVRRVLASEEGQDTELSACLASRNRGPGADRIRAVLERAAGRGGIGPPAGLRRRRDG